MAAPIVDHILPAAVFRRQETAAIPRVVRTGAAVVMANITPFVMAVTVVRIAVAAIGAMILIVGECESAGEQRQGHDGRNDGFNFHPSLHWVFTHILCTSGCSDCRCPA